MFSFQIMINDYLDFWDDSITSWIGHSSAPQFKYAANKKEDKQYQLLVRYYNTII